MDNFTTACDYGIKTAGVIVILVGIHATLFTPNNLFGLFNIGFGLWLLGVAWVYNREINRLSND